MKSEMKTIEGVKTRNGYAIGVYCEKGHSGNQRYAHHVRGYFACQGCMHFITSGDLADKQKTTKEVQ